MDEMKEIEKNEETGTPSETPSKPVEEPPILPSIEDVAIGYQVKKPVETQAECDVYSVVVGKYYSVTSEKQSLLTSNLALYQISTAAGQPFKLTWNSTGDECVEWTYDDLAALALAIGVYVKPFVSHQQEIEIDIKACTTSAEVDAIEISYDAILAEYLDLHADKDVAE